MASGGRERLTVARAGDPNRGPTHRLRFPSPVLAWAWAVLATSAPLRAQAATADAGRMEVVGPHAGSGQRAVNPSATSEGRPSASAGPARAPAAASATKGPAAPAVNYKRGRPPKEPLPSLPPGAPRQPVDAAARRGISGSATDEPSRAGSDDPELRALWAAEQVLFPKPLPGARSGWSWEFPSAPPSREPELFDSGLPPSASPRASVAVEHTADATWLKSLQLPNLPVRFDARVITYLKLYKESADGQAIARAWAKKSGRYTPMLKSMLVQAGLPTDLVWLSLVESGHNPTIRSPAGAAGLWQFMPETAKIYGLTVDRWVDERLDPHRSTEAAVALLSDLHRRFGNWELAMAAYNMGHGGLLRAIRKYNSNDFWELSRLEAGLPWETTLYVPRVLAIAIVMNNKKAFGIDDIEPDPPETVDTVMVEPDVELRRVADAAGIDVSSCARLNPSLLDDRTPPAARDPAHAQWAVHVPVGTAAAAARRLGRSRAKQQRVSHTADVGSVAPVAAKGTTTLSASAKVDDSRSAQAAQTGTAGRAPQRSSPTSDSPEDIAVVVPNRALNYPGRSRVFYRVMVGDTLTETASAFRVGVEDLVEWNSLDTTARLQSGMVLQVFTAPGLALDSTRCLREPKVLVVGTDEFYEHFEAQNGRKRMSVVAREGDTLGSIAQRYDMSVGMMERVNRRSRRDVLEAGERVVVYAPMVSAARSVAEAAAAVQPLQPAAPPPRPDALPPYDRASPRTAGSQSSSSGG
jgi:membrane-bound lytic murein transglycosylase D